MSISQCKESGAWRNAGFDLVKKLAVAFAAIAFSVLALQSPSTQASAAIKPHSACGTVLIQGGAWLGGHGVDVYSNGSGSCGGGSAGWGWQCVDLAYRLYQQNGWGRVFAADGGAATIPEGSPALDFHPNSSGYVPVPGDLIIENKAPVNGNYGHVAVVDSVSGGSINAVEQNTQTLSGGTWVDHPRHTYSWNGVTAANGYASVRGFMHSPANSLTSGPPSNSGPPFNYNVTGTGGYGLNEHSGPSVGSAVVGNVPEGGSLSIMCQTSGDNVLGTSVWDKLQNSSYVTDYYTTTPTPFGFSANIPRCSSTSPPGAPGSVSVSPGNSSGTVTWAVPSSNGGATITSYTATASPGGATCSSSLTSCMISGLTNGTSYSVTVTATNSVGTSGASSSASLTPLTTPGSPTSASAQGANASLVASWAAPSSNGGATITSYTATASPGGATCSSSLTSCTISGLTNGTSYTVSVVASNAAGAGPTSAPSPSAVPLGTPTAPQQVVANPQNTSLQVTWMTPTSTGGSAITSYGVSTTPVGGACTVAVAQGTPTACTLTGLTNGITYVVNVVAFNALGASAPGTSSPVTPATVATAPQGITAIAAKRSAIVSWTAPASTGGAAITSYTVTASPGGASCTTAGSSCVVSVLHLGIAYSFTVVAVNAAGTSASSASSNPVTIGTPSAPTSVGAIAGTSAITVYWPPAPTNGFAVTSYTATASPGGASCTAARILSCSISGLVNGTTYTVTVVATNGQGTSPASAPSAPVIPEGVPSVPTAVAASPLDGGAMVSWTAPTYVGTGVSDYLVVASPGGATCWWSSGPTTCTMSGLTNGTKYTFVVTAFNEIGAGPPSGASASVLVGAPQSPLNVVASPRDRSVVVSWDGPVSGAATPNTYKVTAVPGGKTCIAAAPVTSCTVSGLFNGTSYTFVVAASNTTGTSSPSQATLSVTPLPVPGSPSNPLATAGPASAVVTWSAPAAGSSAVGSYTATATPGGQTCNALAPVTTCTISGLTNGTSYTFTVMATNNAGSSPPTSPSAAVIPADVPSAPTVVTATKSDGSVVVSWSASTPNGSPVTGYAVTSSPSSAGCTSTATTCTVTGLTNGTSYVFSVTASNGAGKSQSGVAPAVTPSGTPTTPSGLQRTDSSQTAVRLAWSDASGNGATIDLYTVKTLQNGQTCTAAPGTGNTCVVSGLSAGTTYSFEIQAHNANGSSAWSAPVTGTTLSPPPPSYFVGVVDAKWSGASCANERTSATSSAGLVTCVANGTHVNIACQISGQVVSQNYGVWDRLDNGNYIWDALIGNTTSLNWTASIPRC